MDLEKEVDLNTPAFGPGADDAAEPGETQSPESRPEDEVEVEPEKVAPVVAEPEPESGQKVPYSRFEARVKAAQEADRLRLEAEERAEHWKAIAEAKNPPSSATDAQAPDWWVEMYGDSENSLKAWKVQDAANERLKKEARDEAVRAYREEAQADKTREQENLDKIESGIASVESVAGRTLTEKEQSEVLDIVDEWTPKDAEGNYLGAPIPFEKAWEIHELRGAAAKVPKTAARNAAASASAATNAGDVNVQADRNKDFDPRDWDAYKKRL